MMLSVIVMLCVIMLSVIGPSFIMLLSDIMLNVARLSVI
jgi:hypothetical protein